MTVIEEQETESEWQKVEKTETVKQIQCDVCGHEYAEDEWDGNEFAVNPEIEREAHALGELSELFDAYHKAVPIHVVEDGYDGHEMHFNVPKRELFDVVSEEIPLAQKVTNSSPENRLARAGRREKYADMVGTNKIYVDDSHIHHFMYELNVEASSDDYKHVCDDCYDVIFDET